MINASCNCGTVSFSIHQEVSDIYVCHCSICRRGTGCQGITVVVVENDVFEWRSGEEQVKTWHKPNHDWLISFCQTCGSPVPGKNDDNTTYIPAGLLVDSADQLKVAHHIWVDSKAPWDHIGDEGQQHLNAIDNS